MSERTFTIRLTGPQFRALSKAITERLFDLDEPGTKQERGSLDLAWNQIQAGWHGNPTGGIVPPFITDNIPGHEGDQP